MEQQLNTKLFYIANLNCGGCVKKVEKLFESDTSITDKAINLAARSLWVESNLNTEEIMKKLSSVGFDAQPIQSDRPKEEDKQNSRNDKKKFKRAALLSLMGFGLMLAMQIKSVPAIDQPIWIYYTAFIALLIGWGGQHIYKDAFRSLYHMRPNMNSLVGLGTLSAFVFSTYSIFMAQTKGLTPNLHVYFESSLLILGFVNFGQALEARARRKANKAMNKLIYLTPELARRIRGTEEMTVPVAELSKGDKVKILAGERFPVDGEIIEGASDVSETFFTGEPDAIYKEVEQKVLAGSLNHTASLLVKVERSGHATEAARIIQLIQKAQGDKPRIARKADAIAAIFTPIILAIAATTAFIWFSLTGDMDKSFTTALAVLVIACPCALGLATPISVVLSMSKAANQGLLFRSAAALEKLPDVDTIVFDKTGTLTEGNPSIQSIQLEKGVSEKRVLHLAKILEAQSTHPLAPAFTKGKELTEEDNASVENHKTEAGLGVSATIKGKECFIGSAKMMQHHDISFNSEVVEVLTRKGETVIILAEQGKALAYFGLKDALRPSAIKTIKYLQSKNYEIVMLSGDNKGAVSDICNTLEIKTFLSGVTPNEKLKWIGNAQKQGKKVMMVGDGMNDAPALKRSYVSLAMGTGAGTAIEAADITIKSHNLWTVPTALELGQATVKNVKQNLFGAFVFNSLAIPFAAGALYPLTGMLLSPAIAGLAMALSSVTVVASASRMRLWKAPVFKEKIKPVA